MSIRNRGADWRQTNLAILDAEFADSQMEAARKHVQGLLQSQGSASRILSEYTSLLAAAPSDVSRKKPAMLRQGLEDWLHYSNLLALALELGQVPAGLSPSHVDSIATLLTFEPIREYVASAPFPLCAQLTSKIALATQYSERSRDDIAIMGMLYADVSHAYINAVLGTSVMGMVIRLRSTPESRIAVLQGIANTSRESKGGEYLDRIPELRRRAFLEFADILVLAQDLSQACRVKSHSLAELAVRSVGGLGSVGGLSAPLFSWCGDEELLLVRDIVSPMIASGVMPERALSSMAAHMDRPTMQSLEYVTE